MKKLIAVAVAVSVATCGFAENPVDYRSWILANGGTPVSAGGTSGKAYHASYPPKFAFDGDVSADTTKRYIGEIKDGACLIFGADMGDKTFPMSSYRICQLTAGDYANDRAPTAWTLYGGDTVEGPWTEIETRSGVTWSGELGQKKAVPVIDDCWRFFRLPSAQTCKFYKIAFTASRVTTSVTWDVGVMEVEFFDVPEVVRVTFVPPHAETAVLTNSCAYSTTIYDESAYPVDADHALSFAGFDAAGNSTTVFKGGWWDFGLGVFLPTDLSGRTVTLEGGAVVTSVGAVTLAGAAGINNKLRITDGSAMSAASVTLGAKDGEQHNDLEIIGGSSLTLSGNLKMSAYPNRVGNNGNNRTRNVVTVAGEGTTLDVTGSTFLSWVNGSDGSYNASTGGNTLYVTNGATASLGNLYLTQGLFYGGDDIAYFADGAHITTKSIRMADSWSSAGSRSGVTRLTVASGATVTNTGVFALGTNGGNTRSSPDMMELVVSNGTFHTDQLQNTSNVSTLLAGPRATIRLTGPETKATFRYTTASFATFSKTDNTFIIENGAKFNWPWGSFSYTADDTRRETVIVRGTGSKMTFGAVSNFGAGNTPTAITAYTNRFLIADGAVAEGSSMKIGGRGGELAVSNATLSVSDNKNTRLSAEPVGAGGNITALAVGVRFQYGGIGTNCVVSLSGTCPHLVCTNGASAEFHGATRLVFNLPAEGYDADVVPFEVGNLLTMTANCEIHLNGVQDMLARHRELDKEGAKYVLVKAKTLSVPESILETTRASLPENVKLTVRNAKDGNKELVLQVGKRGLVMIVR